MSIFDKIKIKRPRSSKFDLSHERKFSMKMGDLVPIMLQEIVPGDSFRASSEVFMRFAPMLAPIMHRVEGTIHHFFVPNRLTWNSWEDFITGGEDGTLNPAFPTVEITDSRKSEFFSDGTLADFLGVAPVPDGVTITDTIHINHLPFRAYAMIYNEYYRDQTLNPELPIYLGDGNDNTPTWTSAMRLRKRSWEKDYFTSALPWAQRGGEVVLPVTVGPDTNYLKTSDGTNLTSGTPGLNGPGDDSGYLFDGDGTPLNMEMDGTSVSINELRKSYRLQEWLEKNARAGSRYIEQILSHFGVRSSDSRLQRPEYLGGGKFRVQISEVLNTTGIIDDTKPAEGNVQGYMSGHGISVGKDNGFTRKFEEHGFILSILSVIPRTAYQDGIPRIYHKFDKFDYAWPEFANIGEQEIQNQELFANYGGTDDERKATFGYQSRYSEYKYGLSSVHGAFRNELDYWHLGRKFTSPPALNGTFVQANPDTRIFNVIDPTEDHLYCQVYNKVSAIRPLPYFGTPIT